MRTTASFRLQLSVFALVSASFANIYITQPVLPVLQQEFASDLVTVSLTVSAVILGIALSNLPFGFLSDRWPIHPIIFTGGLMVSIGGLVCATTDRLAVLIAARFTQGLFIPALTTCLAAYLAKSLPAEKLNVVMGAYVSATVLGGLGGRLLGGWLHPPLHWRYAFVSAAVLTLAATVVALRGMPRLAVDRPTPENAVGFATLLRRWAYLRLYACAAGSFAVFSSIFNYLPYRLSDAPFFYSTQTTTLLYLVYIVGIFMGPLAGRISNRLGSGTTLIAGAVCLGAALAIVSMPAVAAVVIGLIGVCAGFFTVHAAAVGALNRKLVGGQGRANALYVLFYYSGGWLGITASGLAYRQAGWSAVIYLGWVLLLIPVGAGIMERRANRP
ncbi:MAG: MFS transporter [Desulfobacteraceae bacterium]|nr:MAG: MFS transporter [Desulfobacteraceae bacterium]